MSASTPRGRFAPSPTGHPTVGNARTAILAWLDVTSRGGQLVLRLDDTDASRESITPSELTNVLHQLGLSWHEGWDVGGPYAPYETSNRVTRHREIAEVLLSAGHAYWDYSLPIADVSQHKETRAAQGQRPGGAKQMAYRGSSEPVADVKPVLRLRVKADRVSVRDRVFGDISVAGDDIGEVALLRSDGRPTYHLASCVDDIDMGITSIVRGADWLNFLPHHSLIFQALDADMPDFAHVPLLVGNDGQKLSKRHGDLSIHHLVDIDGTPAGALCAYLANLGFAEHQDLLTLQELAEGFDIGQMNRTSPRFDPKKLRSFARRWMSDKEDTDELTKQIVARVSDLGVSSTDVSLLLDGIRSRVSDYQEASRLLEFLADPDAPSRNPELIPDVMATALLETTPWDAKALEATVAEEFSVYTDDRKQRFAALRDALAPGHKITPPLHYLLLGLGRDRAQIRLQANGSPPLSP